jgi:hypothetical protein
MVVKRRRTGKIAFPNLATVRYGMDRHQGQIRTLQEGQTFLRKKHLKAKKVTPLTVQDFL